MGGFAALLLVACGRFHFDRSSTSGSGDGGGDDDGGPGDSFVAASDAPTSAGARLRPRNWIGDGNVIAFADFFDASLDLSCGFVDDMTGTTRCFPDSALIEAFEDDVCGVPAVRAGAGCSAYPSLATSITTTVDGDRASAYVVGGTITSPYVRGFICQPASDGHAYFSRGAAAPDASFVAGQQLRVQLPDGFSRVELVGEDGSQHAVGTEYNGTACTVQHTTSTSAVCIPSASPTYATAASYADGACTQQIVPGLPTPAPANVTLQVPTTPCSPLHYMATGAQQVRTQIYYFDASGTCTSATVASATYTAVTDVTSTLPALTRSMPGTAGRLQPITWTSPAGAEVPGRVWDTSLGIECDPVTQPNGTTTCVPVNRAAAVTVWTMANCNGPAPQGEVICDGGNTVQSPSFFVARRVATCDGPSFAVTTYSTVLSTQTAYTKDAQMNCVKIDMTGGVLYDTTITAYDPSTSGLLTIQ